MTSDNLPYKRAILQPTDSPNASAPQVLVQAIDLVKVYGEDDTAVRALDGLSASFSAGTFSAIMGPSGSGKSTLMHCLAGLDQVTSGVVVFAGIELTALTDRKLTALRRDQVGFVFQQFNLLPTLTAEQNILLPLDLAGRKPDKSHFDAVVSSLDLTERLRHLPSQLSGGQQQRVAVARALITKPQVIFADEPTGALDSRNSQQLLSYLRRCTDRFGQTIIMVTHDPNAAAYADRALILSDGQIREDLDQPDADLVLGALRRLSTKNA
jgi:putative ABC transport system ATP-binding protein